MGLESKGFDRQRFRANPGGAVALRPAEAVRRGRIGDGPLPLVLEPGAADVDLLDWLRGSRDEVLADLARHGAVLLRGFDVVTAPVFEALSALVCDELFDDNGEHPREAVDGKVYTPTFYPADHKLLWHNENSFNDRWPTKILFCCVQPAASGGETPLVDSRQVFAAIEPRVRDRFLALGVTYVRNFHPGLGLGWQEVFQTDDRREVERRCHAEGIELEWVGDGRLRTRARRPAAVLHPQTGEASWFNQAQHWHLSCLDPESRESMRSLFSAQDLPRQCYYGDGSEIDDADMAQVLAVYDRLEVAFPWERGDVLLVDNVLAAHARNPFAGRRKLLVALGDMESYDRVQVPAS